MRTRNDEYKQQSARWLCMVLSTVLDACGGNELTSDWTVDTDALTSDEGDRRVAASGSTSSASTRSVANTIAATTETSSVTAFQGASAPATEMHDSRTTEVPNTCGNGVVDVGETCDDGPQNSGTRADACRRDCTNASCGDGVRDDGERCDTGTQNSDTEPDSCRTDCTLPRCGDGVVDVVRGETCDGTIDCGDTCSFAECGNDVVEGSEECELGLDPNCQADCTLRECAGGALECEENGPSDSVDDTGGDPVADSSSGQTSTPAAPTADETGNEPAPTHSTIETSSNGRPPETSSDTASFGFDSDAQGWVLYETSPESMAAATVVAYDGTNGENSQGALKLAAPFDARDQKLEAQVQFDAPRDLRGRWIRARARLASGLSSDTQNPGGIKLFVKTGDNFSYAAGEFVALTQGGGWVEFGLNVDTPDLVFQTDEYDPAQVRQVGIELRTFEQTTQASAATVYVDNITL
jgi:hypothetical protein